MKAHEHFCWMCFGHGKTNGMASGWYRCLKPHCTLPMKQVCKKHAPGDEGERRDDAMKHPVHKQYSGPNSVNFWTRVRALPQPYVDDLYLLGCALQDFESRVHQLLRHYEEQAVAKDGQRTLRPKQTKVRAAGKHQTTQRVEVVRADRRRGAR